MNRLGTLLTALGLGAGLAYYLDPVAGGRRRALLRDHVIYGARKTRKMTDAKIRHLKNRAYGTFHELKGSAQDVAEAITGEGSRSNEGKQALQETSGSHM